jgi:hypothetical protein
LRFMLLNITTKQKQDSKVDSLTVLNVVDPSNVCHISVTFETSHEFKFWLKALASENTDTARRSQSLSNEQVVHMKGKKHSPKKVSLIVETEATFQGDTAPLKAVASVKRDFQHKL